MTIAIQYYSFYQSYCKRDNQKIKSLEEHFDRTRKIVEKRN